jgi:hypothetical protein
MHTLMVLTALTIPGAAPPARSPDTLSWEKTYSDARKRGQQEGKPLAVFFGSGARGWEAFTPSGKRFAGLRRFLASRYVCVYIDTGSARGRKLASAFAVPTDHGLVISTRDGQNQAFRHEGRMTTPELRTTLEKYSRDRAVVRTETLHEGTTSTRTSAAYTHPTAPTVQPRAFSGSFGGFGGFSGGGGC